MNLLTIIRRRNLVFVFTLAACISLFYSYGTVQNIKEEAGYRPLDSATIDVDLSRPAGEMTPLYAYPRC